VHANGNGDEDVPAMDWDFEDAWDPDYVDNPPDLEDAWDPDYVDNPPQ
jgi:hypothetical protein